MSAIDRVVVFLVTTLTVAFMFWIAVSFIVWDVTWLTAIDDWHEAERLDFILVLFIIVGIAGLTTVLLDDE